MFLVSMYFGQSFEVLLWQALTVFPLWIAHNTFYFVPAGPPKKRSSRKLCLEMDRISFSGHMFFLFFFTKIFTKKKWTLFYLLNTPIFNMETTTAGSETSTLHWRDSKSFCSEFMLNGLTFSNRDFLTDDKLASVSSNYLRICLSHSPNFLGFLRPLQYLF